MQRYDLSSPRPKKDGSTFWQKVGSAFPRDDGSFHLVLDAYPLPGKDGRVSLIMSVPRPRPKTGKG